MYFIYSTITGETLDGYTRLSYDEALEYLCRGLTAGESIAIGRMTI